MPLYDRMPLRLRISILQISILSCYCLKTIRSLEHRWVLANLVVLKWLGKE